MRNVMAIDKGKIIGIPSAASGVSYDNTDSGLTSTNVQDAIDEVSDDLSDKVDKVTGKGLSTNDYTDAEKAIVDGVTSALAGKVSTASVGSANGVAELDANGRVPSSQLPSYVDDVLEYADLAHFPATGETGKIYIAEDTNKTYRWSGSDYAEISESLALGETSSTAYAGNKGKANADAIAAIKNGTSINSFGAVETALQSYATKADVDGLIGNLNALTTTDKTSCVGAINELDAYTKRVYRSRSLINISAYDSSDNLYTVPNDGMVILAVNDIAVGAKIALIDYDLNADIGESVGNGSTQLRANISVIKGQRIYFVKTNAGNSTANYYPKVNPS